MSDEKWITCKIKQKAPDSAAIIDNQWCTADGNTDNAPDCNDCAFGHKWGGAFAAYTYCCDHNDLTNNNTDDPVKGCAWNYAKTGKFANVRFTKRKPACSDEEVRIDSWNKLLKPKCMSVNKQLCQDVFGGLTLANLDRKSITMTDDGVVSCPFNQKIFFRRVGLEWNDEDVADKVRGWKNKCLSDDPLNVGTDSVMYKYCKTLGNMKVLKNTETGPSAKMIRTIAANSAVEARQTCLETDGCVAALDECGGGDTFDLYSDVGTPIKSECGSTLYEFPPTPMVFSNNQLCSQWWSQLKDTGVRDAFIVDFCRKFPNVEACACTNRSTNQAYLNIKNNMQNPTSASNDGCWFAPCANPTKYFVTSDITTDHCPDICLNAINIKDANKIYISGKVKQSNDCPGAPPTPTPTPTPTPAPPPTPAPTPAPAPAATFAEKYVALLQNPWTYGSVAAVTLVAISTSFATKKYVRNILLSLFLPSAIGALIVLAVASAQREKK